jgi:hypothetical protein
MMVAATMTIRQQQQGNNTNTNDDTAMTTIEFSGPVNLTAKRPKTGLDLTKIDRTTSHS